MDTRQDTLFGWSSTAISHPACIDGGLVGDDDDHDVAAADVHRQLSLDLFPDEPNASSH